MALEPCRECGQQVSTEAPTCPHCGVPSPTREGRTVEDLSNEMEEKGFTEGVPMSLHPCRSCGHEVSADVESCPQCGAPFPAEGEKTAQRLVGSKQREAAGTAGCLSVGLMVVGGGWALLGLGNVVAGFSNIAESGGGEGWMTANLLVNMLAFILPGLVLLGIGAGLKRR